MKKLWNAPRMEELNIHETACPSFGGPSFGGPSFGGPFFGGPFFPPMQNKPCWPPFIPWWPTTPPCGGGNNQGGGNTEDDSTDFVS